MAFQATGSLLFRIMEMMLAAAVFFCQVAPVAKCIAVHENFSTVRFMTILADHSFLIHLTLQKGSININLLENLPISKVKSLIQQRR